MKGPKPDGPAMGSGELGVVGFSMGATHPPLALGCRVDPRRSGSHDQVRGVSHRVARTHADFDGQNCGFEPASRSPRNPGPRPYQYSRVDAFRATSEFVTDCARTAEWYIAGVTHAMASSRRKDRSIDSARAECRRCRIKFSQVNRRAGNRKPSSRSLGSQIKSSSGEKADCGVGRT